MTYGAVGRQAREKGPHIDLSHMEKKVVQLLDFISAESSLASLRVLGISRYLS